MFIEGAGLLRRCAPRNHSPFCHCERSEAIMRRRRCREARRPAQGGTKAMPQFTSENVCYVKHGERQIMARVFKPEGAGPFPCYIDLHGGAWNNGDLNDRTGLGEYLASRGYVMVTLNFRHAADGYPTTLADIHYGIRWTKANAKELKVNPDQVV